MHVLDRGPRRIFRPLGPFLWGLAGLLLTLALAGCGPKPSPVGQEPPRANQGAAMAPDELYADIHVLELINRLQLSPEQIAPLLEVLRDAADRRVAAQKRMDALLAELAPLLAQKRDALLKGGPVPAAVQSQITKIERDLSDASSPRPEDEGAMAGRLREILSEAQTKVVAGGLEARIDASEMLDGLRDMPAEAFDSEIGLLAGELAGDHADMNAEQVEGLCREMRSLSEEEYRQARDEIIKQLEPLFIPSGETADWLLTRAFAEPRMFLLIQERQLKGE